MRVFIVFLVENLLVYICFNLEWFQIKFWVFLVWNDSSVKFELRSRILWSVFFCFRVNPRLERVIFSRFLFPPSWDSHISIRPCHLHKCRLLFRESFSSRVSIARGVVCLLTIFSINDFERRVQVTKGRVRCSIFSRVGLLDFEVEAIWTFSACALSLVSKCKV